MRPTAAQVRQGARRCLRVVEWSDEDQVHIGSAPPIIGQCCHGKTEPEVVGQLQVIVEDWVKTLLTDGKPLPESTANKGYSSKFVVRIDPNLHKKAALLAMARGTSLNQCVAEAIEKAS